MFEIYDKETGRTVPTDKADKSEFMPAFVIYTDGKVYKLDSNNACGDPECCGAFEQYYTEAPKYGFREAQPEYITITEDMSMQDRMKVQPALGRILKVDIGKRVYFVNGYPQVESLQQFKKRMGKL